MHVSIIFLKMTRRKTVLASDFTSICYMACVYSQYSDGLILGNCSPVMPTSHIVNNLLTSKHFFSMKTSNLGLAVLTSV